MDTLRIAIVIFATTVCGGCYLSHEIARDGGSGPDGAVTADVGPADGALPPGCFLSEIVLVVGTEPGCRSVEARSDESVPCPSPFSDEPWLGRPIRVHRLDPSITPAIWTTVRGAPGSVCPGPRNCGGSLFTRPSSPPACICEAGGAGLSSTPNLSGEIDPPHLHDSAPDFPATGGDLYLFVTNPNLIWRIWACIDAEPEP